MFFMGFNVPSRLHSVNPTILATAASNQIGAGVRDCNVNNGGCDYTCNPDFQGQSATCSCPDLMQLSLDGESCISTFNYALSISNFSLNVFYANAIVISVMNILKNVDF